MLPGCSGVQLPSIVAEASKSLYIQEAIDSDFGKLLTVMIQKVCCFFQSLETNVNLTIVNLLSI
jgi:hypothetical protein